MNADNKYPKNTKAKYSNVWKTINENIGIQNTKKWNVLGKIYPRNVCQGKYYPLVSN